MAVSSPTTVTYRQLLLGQISVMTQKYRSLNIPVVRIGFWGSVAQHLHIADDDNVVSTESDQD